MYKYCVKLTKENNLWKVSVPALDIDGIGYPDYEDTLDFASDLVAEYLKDFVPEKIDELAEKDEEYFKAHSDDVIRVDVDVEAYRETIRNTAGRFSDETKEKIEQKELVQKGNVQEKTTKSIAGIEISNKIIIGGAVAAIAIIIALVAVLLPTKNDEPTYTRSDTTGTWNEDYGADETSEDRPTVTGQKFTQTGNKETIRIMSAGFGYTPGWKIGTVAFTLKNVGGSDYTKPDSIRITVKNEKGEILSSEEMHNPTPMKKGEETGRVEYFFADSAPAQVEYQVIDRGNGMYFHEMTNLKVENIRSSGVEIYGSTTISGEIVNETGEQFQNGTAYVIYKDAKDNIIGGAQESVSAIGEGKTPFSISEIVPKEFDHCEAYAAGEVVRPQQ